MNEDFYKATRPALNIGKPAKEGNFFSRFLIQHPRLIFPLTGGAYMLLFTLMSGIVLFYN